MKLKTLSVRLLPTDHERIAKEAEDSGMSMNEWAVHRLVDGFYESDVKSGRIRIEDVPLGIASKNQSMHSATCPCAICKS